MTARPSSDHQRPRHAVATEPVSHEWIMDTLETSEEAREVLRRVVETEHGSAQSRLRGIGAGQIMLIFAAGICIGNLLIMLL